ncbi:hypothetical protein [Agrobacterium larrymoorei]|uniref:DUF1294 domain-containing protein n=1 Tax=Agrobacterium larrymoorei TaxID=160699 RepID=A0ABU0UNZ5_9HYPH|nr:hypothetical protein [Agrobacterium larrymoorei]MDQ1186498.1 hypothetical protein [Agrobacterium larrymoorei]
MPIWVPTLVALNALAALTPFLYARKLARKEGAPDEATPKWFGGLRDYQRVASTLRKRSQEGDRWALTAYWIYCCSFVTGPAMIALLFIRDHWSR